LTDLRESELSKILYQLNISDPTLVTEETYPDRKSKIISLSRLKIKG